MVLEVVVEVPLAVVILVEGLVVGAVPSLEVVAVALVVVVETWVEFPSRVIPISFLVLDLLVRVVVQVYLVVVEEEGELLHRLLHNRHVHHNHVLLFQDHHLRRRRR